MALTHTLIGLPVSPTIKEQGLAWQASEYCFAISGSTGFQAWNSRLTPTAILKSTAAARFSRGLRHAFTGSRRSNHRSFMLSL